MPSYFEIAGEIIDAGYQDDEPFLSDMEYAEVAEILLTATGDEGYDLKRAARVPGRTRRLIKAGIMAGTLASADGPLPIGDVIAIGFLTGYAVYEAGMIVGDLRQ